MARPKTNPNTVTKQCPTCRNNFEISFYLRNRRTYCSKTCSNRDPLVVAKMVESQTRTYEERYGTHPMKTEETKKNLKNSIMEKYGVEWVSSKEGWSDTVKKNNLIKYGTETFNNTEKRKRTCIEKYGVDNYTKTTDYKNAYKQTCMQTYGVPHASQSTNFKIAHYETMFDRFLSNPRFVNFSPKFNKSDYAGTEARDYPFRCKRCGLEKLYCIDNGRFPICPTCDQLNMSFFQKEVYDFLLSLMGTSVDIQINDRRIIYPKELDIVIPSLKIAIECNGLVWHSEIIGRKNKTYHLYKTVAAMTKEYRVIHVQENEWTNKQEIVKSLLQSAVGKSMNKINARDCQISEVSSKECAEFLKNNHMQGVDHSTIKIGLYHEKKLVSLMTFVKSRFDKKIQWEMSRFCNLLLWRINGGASKLFSYFLKNYNPTSIVSYSDRRYFDGALYVKLGFQFIHNSSPNYHYIIDNYLNTQNRVSWQKHKLKNKLKAFDASLSEWENMKLNGFDRIWDCGNGKWVWRIN